MPATNLYLQATISWGLTRPNGVYAPTTQTDSQVQTLSGINIQEWDQVFTGQVIIPAPSTAGDSWEIDLYSFENLVGEQVTGDRVLAIAVAVSYPSGGQIQFGPSDTLPLQWFFNDPAAGIIMADGDYFLFAGSQHGKGYPVDATHRHLVATNLAGTGEGDVTVSVTVFLSSTVSDITVSEL